MCGLSVGTAFRFWGRAFLGGGAAAASHLVVEHALGGAHSRARGRDIALRLRELAAQLLVQRVEPRVLVVGGRRAGSGVIALLVQLPLDVLRSEEHTSELQSLMRISYAVFCLKKKKKTTTYTYRYKTQRTTHY